MFLNLSESFLLAILLVLLLLEFKEKLVFLQSQKDQVSDQK